MNPLPVLLESKILSRGHSFSRLCTRLRSRIKTCKKSGRETLSPNGSQKVIFSRQMNHSSSSFDSERNTFRSQKTNSFVPETERNERGSRKEKLALTPEQTIRLSFNSCFIVILSLVYVTLTGETDEQGNCSVGNSCYKRIMFLEENPCHRKKCRGRTWIQRA